jgi:hypothetical protein
MIDLIKGSYYFAIKCPTTGNVLAIADDHSGGWKTYMAPEVFADCHHCAGTHRLPGLLVFSFLHA